MGIGDRAPTYTEWKALLEYVEKSNTQNQFSTTPNRTYITPITGVSQFTQAGHPGVPATAAKNY